MPTLRETVLETISNMEQVRQINCCNIECDNWEEFPEDMPRTSSQNFKCVEVLENNQAKYLCTCGYVTESEIIDKE